MFFIGIFGGGIKAKPLGSSNPRNCPRCHNTEPWTIFETRKTFSAFFIPIMSWGRSFHISCPICGETRTLDSYEEAIGMAASRWRG